MSHHRHGARPVRGLASDYADLNRSCGISHDVEPREVFVGFRNDDAYFLVVGIERVQQLPR